MKSPKLYDILAAFGFGIIVCGFLGLLNTRNPIWYRASWEGGVLGLFFGGGVWFYTSFRGLKDDSVKTRPWWAKFHFYAGIVLVPLFVLFVVMSAAPG